MDTSSQPKQGQFYHQYKQNYFSNTDQKNASDKLGKSAVEVVSPHFISNSNLKTSIGEENVEMTDDPTRILLGKRRISTDNADLV